jgi:hypothetical protein
MNRALKFAVAAVLALISLRVGAADAPVKLTTAQVESEKHLWPDQVAPKKTIEFVDARLSAGTPYTLVGIEGEQVTLASPKYKLVFPVPIADTDLMARALQLRQKLAPEQRALDLEKLRASPELWPAEFTMRGARDYPNGNKYADGDTLTLVSVEGDQIWFTKSGLTSINHIHPHETTLFSRARAILATPPEKRVPRLTRLLQGKLLPAAKPVEGVKPTDPPPGTKHYVLMTLAADTPDAGKILLDVARFYGPVRGKHPEVEVVMFGLDKATAEKKVPWRVVDPKQADKLFWLREHNNTQWHFPNVAVYDANGLYRDIPDSLDLKAMLENFTKSLDAPAEAK